MSRKKRMLMELILLFLLVFIYLRLSHSYLSAEQLLHANERGLHYGPSQEFLLEHKKGTNVLAVGLVDERSLSVIQGKQWGPIYRLRSGGITGFWSISGGRKADSFICRNDGVLLGLVDMKALPEAASVICYVYMGKKEEDGWTLKANVQRNGFFRTDIPVPEENGDEFCHMGLMKVYDCEGKLLFTEDF